MRATFLHSIRIIFNGSLFLNPDDKSTEIHHKVHQIGDALFNLYQAPMIVKKLILFVNIIYQYLLKIFAIDFNVISLMCLIGDQDKMTEQSV